MNRWPVLQGIAGTIVQLLFAWRVFISELFSRNMWFSLIPDEPSAMFSEREKMVSIGGHGAFHLAIL